MKDNVFFVGGIDTNVRRVILPVIWQRRHGTDKVCTITQKFVQTGNVPGYVGRYRTAP